MNARAMVPVSAAVDALVAAAIVFGTALASLLLMWLIEDGMQTPWSGYVTAAAAVLLLAYGAPLHLSLDLSNVVGAADPVSFTVSLLPLTLTAVIVVLAFVSGRRSVQTRLLFPAWLTLIAVQYALIVAFTQLATIGGAVSLDWRVWVVPVVIYLLPYAIGGLCMPDAQTWERERLNELGDRIAARTGTDTITGIRLAIRTSGALIVATAGMAGVILGLLFLAHWMNIATLFESLHVGFMGLVVLGLAQLAYLVNVLIWVIAWLSGVGFFFGAGTSLGPLGSDVGPLPTIPVLGAIPQGALAFGLAAVLVPVLAAVLAAVVVQRSYAARWALADRPLVVTLVGAGGGAVLAAAAFALVGLLASGSLGPGRLDQIGVNAAALLIALCVEFAIGVAIVIGGSYIKWIRRMADRPRVYADPLFDHEERDDPAATH